jgi:hypothetical protein
MSHEPSQRKFLKTMLGSAAGVVSLATTGSLLTPRTASAAYGPGAAPDGGDLVDTNLTVLGDVTVKGPHPWTDVRAYGAVGDGVTDDTGAIQSAIDSIGPGGGTVFFPSDYIFRCAGTLVLDNREGIRLLGGRVGAGNPIDPTPPTLLFTGTGASFLSLHSVVSVGLRSLCIRYNNAAFSGDLVDFDWSALNRDPVFIRIEDCSFAGILPARNARSLVRLNRTIVCAIRDCWFGYAGVGILGGSPHYSNAIQVEDCCFNYQSVSAIKNAVDCWLIQGCTFEPRFDGSACGYTQDPGRYAWGLNLVGNWFGDATQGGTWVTTQALGLNFSGNRFEIAGPNSTCLRLTYSEGVQIAGNHFAGNIGIDVVGFAIGLSVMGNKFFGVALPVNNQGAISGGTGAYLGNSGLDNLIF